MESPLQLNNKLIRYISETRIDWNCILNIPSAGSVRQNQPTTRRFLILWFHLVQDSHQGRQILGFPLVDKGRLSLTDSMNFRKFWGGKNDEFLEKGGGGHANPNSLFYINVFKIDIIGVIFNFQTLFIIFSKVRK